MIQWQKIITLILFLLLTRAVLWVAAKVMLLAVFKTTIEEQKKIKDGKCTVSLFTFSTNVDVDFIGRDVSEVNEIDYKTSGLTAMNDGIGIAIDRVGEWLDSMKEEDKPSQTMVVIMTDGYENASKEYSLEKVKEMIKHQEEKYSWKFVYLGSDLTSAKDSNSLGIDTTMYYSKKDTKDVFYHLTTSASMYRNESDTSKAFATMDCYLNDISESITRDYETSNSIDLGRKKKSK